MSILSGIFGPSIKDVWKTFSEQSGSVFIEGGFFKGSDKVVAKYKEWKITLDTETVTDSNNTSTTYTRIRTPYVNNHNFRFSIYRRGIFSNIGKYLGFQDVEIGDELFDKNFIIKSSDEDKIKELLMDSKIRELINQQPNFHLDVKDDQGWFGKSFPKGVDMLNFRVPVVIKNVEELKGLFEIFSEVLNRLCIIGEANQSPPGVEL